jgi:indole-3-glycerol phosphate synthase
MWVSTSSADGPDLLRSIAKEQQTAKGKFPGPVPIVMRERVVDVAQIAMAAGLGASGITLSADALDVGELKQFLAHCSAAGIEGVVEASDREGLGRAGEAGATIVCVRGVSSLDEAVDLRSDIPQVMMKPITKSCHLNF